MPHKIPTHNPFPSTYEQSTERKADRAFYNGRPWRENRELFLQDNPFCIRCLKEEGRYVSASVVDHVIPRKEYVASGGDPYAWENLQSMCRHHHALKSAEEQRQKTQGKTLL